MSLVVAVAAINVIYPISRFGRKAVWAQLVAVLGLMRHSLTSWWLV